MYALYTNFRCYRTDKETKTYPLHSAAANSAIEVKTMHLFIHHNFKATIQFPPCSFNKSLTSSLFRVSEVKRLIQRLV